MRQREIVKRYVTKINEEINGCGLGLPRIISLKILYPSNTQRTELQPLLALCDKISYEKYIDFEAKYVNQSDGTLRSLSFLNYKEAVKLDKIENSTNACNEGNAYEYYEEKMISVDPLKLEKDNEKVESYWTDWKNYISSVFKNGKSTLWSYVVVPRQLELNKGPVEFTASAFLIFSDIICEKAGILINKYCQDLLIECITSHFYDDIKLQATKSAINEIINRNMAHHITSHVSNRATLDKVLDRIGKSYTNLSDPKLYQTVLDLLNRFNQYRDERSEYLTYITNFSSASSAYFFQDIIRPFVENTLLMDNIAANENINYNRDLKTNKLQLKVKYNTKGKDENFYAEYYDINNTKLYCSESLPYLRLKNDNLEYPYDKIAFSSKLKDIEVSLPGTLGKHALYSILENFIRNSAKHGLEQKKNGLDIIILLNDKEDNIEVTLTDNCSFVTEEKIKEFNESIQTEILKRKDLGLIDMKVNACLLAGMELNDENCKKALTAVLHKKKLAYKFKIAKPKKAVFIGDFVKEENNNKGFYFFKTIEDYRKSDTHKSFEFAILSDDLYDKQKNLIASELPARVLKYSEIESSKIDVIEHLYEVWLKNLRGDKKASVSLFFEQNDNTNDEPTKKFKAKYVNTPNLKVYSNEDLNTGLTITDKKNVLFDRHGGLISKFSKENSLVDTNHSWVLIDKNNPDLDYISRYDIQSKTNLLAYELEEAGLLKVLVIDERVAEQSVAVINDPNLTKITDGAYGFTKFNPIATLTLFDVAWASNVFIATHLNGVILKVEPDLYTQHYLNVDISNDNILLKTNITSKYGKLASKYCATRNEIVNEWEFNNSSPESPQIYDCNFIPDVMIIHRTKLKELVAKYEESNKDFVADILAKYPNLNIVITTGSGTTHGIKGDFKILPFTTLSSLLLGNRVKKLHLTKLIMQLTKNKK